MSGSTAPVVVVGGGHNGLVAACYLARAGRRVLVLEAADKLGGGSRTDETIPGHRFNTHSAAHNIINMTSIPAELDLAGAGLEYLPMEPFATGFFRDGRIVRFSRDIEQTVASIAEHDRADAEAYRALHAPRRAAGADRRHRPGERLAAPAGCSRPSGRKLWPLLQGLQRVGRAGRAGPRPGHPVRLAAAARAALATSPARRCRRSPATPPPGRTSPAARSTSSGRRRTTCTASGTPAAARSR